MQSKEKDDQEIQNEGYDKFVECAKFEHIFKHEGCQKAATTCNSLAKLRDF